MNSRSSLMSDHVPRANIGALYHVRLSLKQLVHLTKHMDGLICMCTYIYEWPYMLYICVHERMANITQSKASSKTQCVFIVEIFLFLLFNNRCCCRRALGKVPVPLKIGP